MRNIYRTITFTAATGQRISPLGEFVDVSEVLEGKWTAREAQARLRKKMRDDTICINYVETDTAKYRLTGEDFLKYATVMD